MNISILKNFGKTLFDHFRKNGSTYAKVVGGAVFNHCLPYNGNECLLNTNNGVDMCTVNPFRKYQIVAVRNGSKDNWHIRLYGHWSSDFYFVCINPDKSVMDNLEKWRECESAQNVWRQCSL